jgi:predicted CopG family antitoxin
MMPDKKTVKISEEAHERLSDYKEEYGHTSFDSAIREAINDSYAWRERGSDLL